MDTQLTGQDGGSHTPIQIGLASAKSSPGATTLGLALGLVWPSPVVVGELDPAGGDLAGRLPIEDPIVGLAALAADARHGLSWEVLVQHTQPLTDRCHVLLSSPDRVLSSGAVGVLADAVANAARSAGVSGIWDLGRLEPGSPSWPAVWACDVVAVVIRATATDVSHGLRLVEELLAAGTTVGLVVAATGQSRRKHRDHDVAEEIARRTGGGVGLLGGLPRDGFGVSMAERVMPRLAGRSALGSAVREMVPAIVRAAQGSSVRGVEG